MAEVMEKKIDENQKHDEPQKPTYAAILKRASPRTTATQSQITTAAVKRVASEEENEPAVTKASVTIANVERKNGDVKTLPRTQSETGTQQENGWKTVPGNFSPIPHTSFVRSIPMIYPVKPQNITQKSPRRMKAPKSKKAQSGSTVSEGGAVSLQDIRLGDVAPSIDDTNPKNSQVRNAESFGTLLKNKVVKKLKSVKDFYRKWSKTETEVLLKYMPTKKIERNSRERQISSRVLFAIGFILFAVFGAIFLIQMLQGDYQGSRHLMAGTKKEKKAFNNSGGAEFADGLVKKFTKNRWGNMAISVGYRNMTGAFILKGETLEFYTESFVYAWTKQDGAISSNSQGWYIEIRGFKRGPGCPFELNVCNSPQGKQFVADLKERFGDGDEKAP